ncbi:MAG TPA: TonB-dependent receptor [Terriglobales bacterium]
MTIRVSIERFFLLSVVLVLFSIPMPAQQTLGSITGTVSDPTAAVVQKAEIALVNHDTGLEKSTTTGNDGSFLFADLPIGTYTLTFTHAGFRKEVHDQVLVQANRTTSVLVRLQPGGGDTTIEVTGTPLLNRVDTTNGYVLNSQQIEETPLGTGSFTQLAVLSPGVSADFLGGTGTNAGLGNQAIWANGQRDTSNTFTINSVDVSNIFNGKSGSQLPGNRNVLNTGENFLNNGATIQTNTSVYDAIGQGLPSPPPETIQELRVNTSMYDATQGETSGAHINVQTRSGTNAMHGQLYGYRDFGGLDANNFFNNNAENGTITNPVTGAPAPIAQPPLHRGIVGATLGGPIVKDKLFYFGSYQYTTVTDTLGGLGAQGVSVPTELGADRSTAGLSAVATALNGGTPVTLNPVAVTLLQFKLPNGQFLIPSAQNSGTADGTDTSILSPASTFIAHQANGNLDYILNQKDQIFLKAYFQVDPTNTPFTRNDNLLGFPQQLLSQAQTASIQNVISLSPSLTWDQKIGFVREKVFSTAGQPLTAGTAGINVFGSQQFPGITIRSINDPNAANTLGGLQFGPNSNFANTGVAQNEIELGSNLTWAKGRHTLQFGGNFDHSQLNIINLANQVGFVGFNNFLDFLTGNVATTGRETSQLFTGSTSRYYRASQVGLYASDKIRLTKTLNFTAGLRYDWEGPLSEVNGNLINFDPTKYQFNSSTDTIVNDGLVVAGNNKQFATPGESNSTLTGRQWGISPRLGLAWSPTFVRNVVVRAGWGMYYDRGEFFTEFSPTAGGGINGPFGATLQPPSVVETAAPVGTTFQNPFGTTAPPAGQTLQAFASSLNNLAALGSCTSSSPGFPFCAPQPFEFGGYDPRNKLPYSENWNLDIQWQPVNDWVITAAYIGNHGVHEIEPIPFNQPGIATPQNPINGQTSSYGYNVVPAENIATFDGGNTDLRVPFVGFSPNSVLYQANGISNYQAGQLQVTKRFSHGFMLNTSYTYSHALDEGSALGLFFNGNNALDLRQNYASSDFDRTHVLTFNYIYQIPTIASFHGLANKFLNGWGIAGLITFQSGQPYSVIDFSGSEGSIFYGSNDFITNPIVPLAPGFTPQTAGNGQGGLNPNAFAPQFLQPGQDGVPAGDTLESAFSNNGRNLFRGPFQKRGDISIYKDTAITERLHVKYALNVFNVTNTPSFDTANNNVSFNNGFNDPPTFFPNGGAAAAGSGFGLIQNIIGSPRIVQMSLHFTF